MSRRILLSALVIAMAAPVLADECRLTVPDLDSKPIPIKSFSFTGRPRIGTTPASLAFTLIQPLDRTSPRAAQLVATGQRLKRLDLEFVRRSGATGKLEVFQRLRLENLACTRYRLLAGPEGRPLVELQITGRIVSWAKLESARLVDVFRRDTAR